MLWYGGQPLIEQEVQCVVVGADFEGGTPKIRLLVTHDLYKADQLPLISCHFQVACNKGATEESNGTVALM